MKLTLRQRANLMLSGLAACSVFLLRSMDFIRCVSFTRSPDCNVPDAAALALCINCSICTGPRRCV